MQTDAARRHPGFLLLALLLAGAVIAVAQPADTLETLPAQASGAAEVAQDVASVVTQYTAIAFCPVLGVAIVGGWTYLTSPEHVQDQLPFFFQPWFVITCAILSLLFVWKSTVLQFFPVLKKPLDMLAVLTNGVGAVVIFVPMLYEFARRIRVAGTELALLGVPSFTAHAAGANVAAEEPVSWIFVAGATVLAAVTFWALWLLGNVANSLILANPIPFLDVILMVPVAAVFVVLGIAAWLHPFLGLAVSVVFALIALKLAAWAYRWSVFALTFSWDFVTFRNDSSWTRTSELRAFSGPDLNLKIRTMGRIVRQPDGSLKFTHRPFPFAPRKLTPIGNPEALRLGRTITHPCLIRESAPDEDYSIVVRLAPRYRKQEQQLGRALGLTARDIGIRGGIRAAWRWCRRSFADWRAQGNRTAAA